MDPVSATAQDMLANAIGRIAALEKQVEGLLSDRDRIEGELDQMRRLVRGAGAVLSALDTPPSVIMDGCPTPTPECPVAAALAR
jgi:hypothetical protein